MAPGNARCSDNEAMNTYMMFEILHDDIHRIRFASTSLETKFVPNRAS